MEETGAQPLHGWKKFAGGFLPVLKSRVVIIVALVSAGRTCFFVTLHG